MGPDSIWDEECTALKSQVRSSSLLIAYYSPRQSSGSPPTSNSIHYSKTLLLPTFNPQLSSPHVQILSHQLAQWWKTHSRHNPLATCTGPTRHPELNAQTLLRLDVISKAPKKVNPRSKKQPPYYTAGHFSSLGAGLDPPAAERGISEESHTLAWPRVPVHYCSISYNRHLILSHKSTVPVWKGWGLGGEDYMGEVWWGLGGFCLSFCFFYC